ncbi:phage tail terminator-like protein [Shinella sp.]|uniref:phage tail terminator-like protein n=1 Tax=Shinella sp. TaxID=1870904 RepID=UPI00289BE6BA|nr:phage tail terminator-like protein [Shinella sp.]
MATTVEKKIFQALTGAVTTFPLPVGWTQAANVALPGEDLVPPLTATTKFISVEFDFNRPIPTDAVSQGLPPIRQGFMRCSVRWPRKSAEVDAIDLAGQLADYFKIGTKLYREGLQVRLDDHPEIVSVPLVPADTHKTVAVIVRWLCFPIVPA